MRVILDALGGDNAPLALIKGGALAAEEYGVQITLVGDAGAISKAAESSKIDISRLEIVDAPAEMPIEAEAADILGKHGDTSMAIGLKMLSEGRGDAFVSAGSTAGLVMGATFIVGRIKGAKRPAIASVVPCYNGRYLLVDCGANHECRPEMLCQFGVMGSVYMNRILGVQQPRVALVNIGTEPNKGTTLYVSAHEKMQQAPINFIGNIEARQVPMGGCDVAVADGFTGNVVLKLSEGFGGFIKQTLKDLLTASACSKAAALLLRGQLKSLIGQMDYSSVGGAPILGIRKPVIKAHGSSNEIAIKNAVRQAVTCAETGMVDEIETGLRQTKDKAAKTGL